MSEQEIPAESDLPRLSRDPSGSLQPSAYRVLSVRTSDATRAQLEVLAQLNNRSLTEETRIALERWVETSKSDPKVLQRAEQVRADIEREAATKRDAITAVLGTATGPAKPATASKGPRAGG